MPSIPRRFRPLLLLGLALALYLPMLGARDVVTSHEARVAQTARRMAESWPWEGRTVEVPEIVSKGRDARGVEHFGPAEGGRTVRVKPWLVPVMNDQIRLQKPPLPYWCAAVLFRLFGTNGRWEGLARLVPALLGAASVLLVYDLARMLMGRTAAWVAGLVWLGTHFLLEEHRKAMADPYLAFFTLLCVWAWVAGSWGGGEVAGWGGAGKGRGDSGDACVPRRHGHAFAFYLAFGLAVLAKGPVAFVHVGVALALFGACYRRWPRWRIGWHAAGLLLFGLVATPWYAYVVLRVPHALDIWHYESVGELTADNTENAREWWFYAPNVLVIALPWIVPWAMGLALSFVRHGTTVVERQIIVPLTPRITDDDHDDDAPDDGVGPPLGADPARPPPLGPRRDRAFAPLWFLVIVVFFSFAQQKKNAYLMPAMAAQTLVITQGLLAVLASARRFGLRRGPAVVPALVQAGIGVAAAAVVAMLVARTPSPARGACLALAAGGAVLAGAALHAIVRQRPRRWLVAQGVAYGLIVAAFVGGRVAPLDNARSARPVARHVEAMLAQDGYTIAADRVPEEAAVYLPLGLRYEPKRHVLAIVDDARGVKTRGKSKSAFVLPDPSAFRSWVDDGRVTDVRRVDMPDVPGTDGDARWKVYDLTVDRRVVVSAETPSPLYSGERAGVRGW